MRFFVVGLLFLSSILQAYPLTPDTGDTPGSLCSPSDSDFAEYRYPERIPYCERKVSSALKNRIYDDYRIPVAERREYTIDHLVPLSLGGDNSRENLWPEHKDVKALRPNLEYQLYVYLRAARITQSQAIDSILRAKFYPCNKARTPSRLGASPCDE